MTGSVHAKTSGIGPAAQVSEESTRNHHHNNNHVNS